MQKERRWTLISHLWLPRAHGEALTATTICVMCVCICEAEARYGHCVYFSVAMCFHFHHRVFVWTHLCGHILCLCFQVTYHPLMTCEDRTLIKYLSICPICETTLARAQTQAALQKSAYQASMPHPPISSLQYPKATIGWCCATPVHFLIPI